MTSPSAPTLVPEGPSHYRQTIRQRGAIAALAPPAILGVIAMLALWNSHSSLRGSVGFVAALLAAPLLPAAGVPLRPGSTATLVAVVASAVLWMAIGVWAARRATRRPAADWRDYWRAYATLAVATWAGLALAGVGAAVMLGVVP